MRNGALLLAVGCLAVSTEAQTPSWWAATGLFAALAVGAEMIRCIGAAMQRDDAKS